MQISGNTPLYTQRKGADGGGSQSGTGSTQSSAGGGGSQSDTGSTQSSTGSGALPGTGGGAQPGAGVAQNNNSFFSKDIPQMNSDFLKKQGLDMSSYKPEKQNPITFGGPASASKPDGANVVINHQGTYKVDAENGRPDKPEFKNTHNTFAAVNTDDKDKVKLDGPGWKKIDDKDNNPKSNTYINKGTNSAVTVFGKGKVVNEKDKPIQ
jgi:hypothetical protein